MTRLSTALNTSLSGLALAGRMTQTISNNVANALTAGYASREVIPTSRTLGAQGGGVAVSAVVRSVDPALLSERRAAEGQYALSSVQADFYSAVETAIGLPDDDSALSNLLSNFNATLIEASTRPESDARLSAILNSAVSVATKLNTAADTVQALRMQADSEIGTAVDFINTTLDRLSELNAPIAPSKASSVEALNRADQRQSLIDQLSEWIPVREIPRANGTVTLFTPGGAILLDGRPAEIGFSASGVITADMSVSGGTLSGLTVNGQPVSVDVSESKIAGGRLSALFDIRDSKAPEMQSQLDAVARDVIERFASSSVDPTLNPTDPGLFTDAGIPLDPLNEPGLSNRISINPLVDPAQGGALWRLRDGLGAVAPGSVGNATLINALSDALSDTRLPASGGFVSTFSSAGLAAEVATKAATFQANFAQAQAFSGSRADALIQAELENGVDTDQEMQRLLLVEQAYAANAKVISTIDELLETLLRI